MILDIYRYLYLLKTRSKDQPIDCIAALRYIDTIRISISERGKERERRSKYEWGRKGISRSCIESLSIR